MTNTHDQLYTSKIIKAGALLADTRTLLTAWDETLSVAQNLKRAEEENIFGKDSRSWVNQFLGFFRQRYLFDPEISRTLVLLEKGGFQTESLSRLLYFHTAKSDLLLHDTVTELLLPLRQLGRTEVTTGEVARKLKEWVEDGKTSGHWSDSTIARIARGLMATLRDFGVLEGAVKKRFAPFHLPIESFAYIAFILQQGQPSGERLIHHPEWQLFFLSPTGVERFFVAAHQERLLEYYAAGSIIRITFPADSIEEYARVILQR